METDKLINFNIILSIIMIIIGIILLISDTKYKYLGIIIIIIFIILIYIHIKNIFDMIKSLRNGEKFNKNFGLLMVFVGIFFLIINTYEIQQNKNKKIV